jgi:hypothetical protein
VEIYAFYKLSGRQQGSCREAESSSSLAWLPAVVEGLGASAAKRAHTSLSAQLDTLSLGSGAGAGEAPGSAAQSGNSSAQRFSRLTTLSAAQVSSLSEVQLNHLIQAQRQQHQQPAAAPERPQQQLPPSQEPLPSQPVDGSGHAAASVAPAPWVAPAPQEPAAASGPAAPSTASRYEQIRQRRRGVTLFQATEAGPDPLAGFATVYEVVQRDSSGEEGGRGPRKQRGGEPELRGGAATQPAAWRQYAEGTLMCNQQPMVREAAAAAAAAPAGPTAEPAPAPPSAAAPGAGAPQPAAPSLDGYGCAAGMEAEGAAGEGSGDDEYVYDLYAAASPAEGEAEWWREMHSSGRAPVIQVRPAWACSMFLHGPA